MSQPKGPNRKKQDTPLRPQGQRRQATQTAGKAWWNKPLILLIPVLAATAAAFLPSLGNDFITGWDDGVYITENPAIRQLNLANMRTFFTESINGTYVPLPLLSFALEYQVFGLEPFGYHLDNLILHLLCTALAFRFLLLLRLTIPFAAFGALLFGIHPMRVETVAWATERKDLLYSLFYLGALIAYIRYIRSEKRRYAFYLLVLALFILSLFSKIQAVALPMSLLLVDYYLERPLQWKLAWEKIPLFGLSLAFGLFGIYFLSDTGSFEINERYTLLQRIFFGLFALCAYLYKFFVPVGLSAFYPYPMQPGNPLPVFYYLSPLALAALAVLVWRTARHTRALVFGSLFFLVNIMFLLQILGAGQAYIADRFSYIPYLGLFFAAAWLLQILSARNQGLQLLSMSIAGAFTIFFLTQTYTRCKDWKDGMTLWTDVITQYPGQIPAAYTNRAPVYRQRQQAELALQDYNVAIQLDSTDGNAFMNRGNIYFDLKQDERAIRDYYTAMNLKAGRPPKTEQLQKLYCNLGSIYGRRGAFDSAIHYLDLSIQTDSSYAEAWRNRALAYSIRGEWNRTITDYRVYLYYNPQDASVHSDIGVGFQNLEQYQESLEWFGRAIALDPDNGTYYLNRSYSYYALKDLARAGQDARQAESLGKAIPSEYLRLLQAGR